MGGNPATWAFRFNWRSPNPQCATGNPSANGSFNQTASGSTLVASNPASDFALLEISAPLPQSWDLVWSGWDRSTTVSDFTVGIHHPRGDIMKVCRDNDSTDSIFDSEFGHLWLVDSWETGVTEPGSSGSPLYNQDGRVIGVLTAGAAACQGTSNNGQWDVYGRFNHAWNNGSSSSSRLRDWLDPDNTGVLTLNAFPDNLSTTSFENIDVNIYPNPLKDILNIESSFENLSFELYDMSGKLMLTSNENQIRMNGLSKGIYLLKVISENRNNSFTEKIIVE